MQSSLHPQPPPLHCLKRLSFNTCSDQIASKSIHDPQFEIFRQRDSHNLRHKHSFNYLKETQEENFLMELVGAVT